MEEINSPLKCPTTVTIRRNPHRSARPTASKTTTKPPLPSNQTLIPPKFPLDEILSMDIKNPKITPPKSPISSNSLNVFLRIRPLPVVVVVPSKSKKLDPIKAKVIPKSCLVVNDLHSITVFPPSCDSNRLKVEEYNGFSRVFSSDSSQDEVYDKMMRPMVEEFLNGRSGLLAALGPSGSGKTHTVFGSSKEPGLVPHALHHIFELDGGNSSVVSRSFYLSIFEIYSEKGKGEKLSDLSPDGSDIHMQQSVVKGLKENLVKDLAEAESLLAQAQLKRATAMTNSNSQSSRSQCIINIRCENKGELESLPKDAMLTFVDLAGAERERKTGNKGGRLLESNFINNTSMVFGLCLRSLLEHQKNPKKPLQKHFQSSLLTRYLRDYMEGRKRMALIMTVRSGQEDYFEASFLLKQASPFMEIKFREMEETTEIPLKKRRHQITGNISHKKVKLSGPESRDNVGMTSRESESLLKEEAGTVGILGGNKVNDASQVDTLTQVHCTDSNLQRQYDVMQGFAKALWVVLKQYKQRVKVMQEDIVILTENLRIGRARYMVMEKELNNVKSQCSCRNQVLCDTSTPNVGCQDADFGRSVDLKEESRSEPIKEELLLLEGPISTNISKAHLEDLPSGEKSYTSAIESIDRFDTNAILTSPSHNTNPSCTDAQVSSPQSYRISHGMRKNDSYGKDQRMDHTKELTDVMDLINQGKSCGSASPKVLEKENVSSGLRNNLNSQLKTKEITPSKPSFTQNEMENFANLPGSIFKSEVETKETSYSKPSKAVRPKRKLVPASSLLLRDAVNIDVTEENVNSRGKSARNFVDDEHKRSKGNTSLLRLLKNHLPR